MGTTVREALNQAMEEEMNKDPKIFILGEEVAEYQGAYKITQGLLEKFGQDRVIDTPITEYGFAGLAVGAAFGGLKPICEFMTFNFAMQAIDHIVNSAAKTLYMSGGEITCPIVFRGPNGAASRVGAQHSQNFASWYANIPGLKVVAPYSAKDAKGLLKSSIKDNNPVVFLENEVLYGKNFEEDINDDYIPLGKAKIVNEGDDLTIVAFSKEVETSILAREELIKDNIHPEIIDLRTIKPLDEELIISSVKKTGRLVILEEGWFYGGIASSIASIVMYKAFDYLDAPIEIISGKDVPMPYAKNLEALSLPSVKDVIEASKRVCYK